jgi:dUTP pyrophosphatase
MSTKPILKVKRVYPRAIIPEYKSNGAAGLDLYSVEEVILSSRSRFLVSTGIALEIPPGYEGQIRPRSGLAVTSGVTVLNSPGTIDSDYRGEIKVLLINFGTHSVLLNAGTRIAQLVIVPVARVEVQEVDDLSNTQRGSKGFGSTGR